MSVYPDNIPQELKNYPQWVVWAQETNQSGDLTKVPYSPHGKFKASSTSPQTWGTYEQALEAYRSAKDFLSGIGFMLSANDPFCFVDLDDLNKCKEEDRKEAEDIQQKIKDRIPGYAEISPSGNGAHIVCRSEALPSGAKWSKYGVEIYTHSRFMTVTGMVVRNAPIPSIFESGPVVYSLWAKIKEAQGNDFEYQGDHDQTKEDQEVIDIAYRAENGEKFAALYEGRWFEHYTGQSEAYLGLMNMIVYYSRNMEQSKRIFMNSPLRREVDANDKDKYATRPKLLDDEIKKAFDRVPVSMNFEEIKLLLKKQNEARYDAAEQESVSSHSAASTVEPGKALAAPIDNAGIDDPVKTFPPGLVGEIAQFIYDAAPRPVREAALVGAIGFLAGITGRAYNVSATGLNQYLMLIAKTGRGKEAVKSGISKLFTAIKGVNDGKGVPAVLKFDGPGGFTSSTALIRSLADPARCVSQVSVLGEFGITLRRLSHHNATTHELGLKQALLDLYNKSGITDTLSSSAFADKDKNTTTINAPAFTMIGESTPVRFYEGINDATISEGLLPRFLVFQYHGERVARNKTHMHAKPHPNLIDKLRWLTIHCMSLIESDRAMNVEFTEEAQAYLDDFDTRADRIMNNGSSDTNDEIWNRAHLKALKLAALVAVGLDPVNPIIGIDAAKWAVAIVTKDAHNILERFGSGEVGEGALGEGANAQTQLIRRIIGEWLRNEGNPAAYGVTPKNIEFRSFTQSSLTSRLRTQTPFKINGRPNADLLKGALKDMIECGYLQRLNPLTATKEFDTSAIMYFVSDLKFFEGAK